MTLAWEIAEELVVVIDSAGFEGVEQVVAGLNLDPTPLSIDVYPAEPFNDDDSEGFGDPSYGFRYTVRARMHTADSIVSQQHIVDLMDADEGMAVALEDDQSLNGLASSVKVEGPTGLRPYRGKGESIMVGCEWTVLVLRETS